MLSHYYFYAGMLIGLLVLLLPGLLLVIRLQILIALWLILSTHSPWYGLKQPCQRYLIRPFTITHYQDKQISFIIVDCTGYACIANTRWSAYLYYLTMKDSTYLLLRSGVIWKDALFFSLPKAIHRDKIYAPRLVTPQLTQSCEEFKYASELIQCKQIQHECHYLLQIPCEVFDII